ncbi:hypothetical protein HYT05_02850 [Candidatus Kaiserbacteria bacterium]|nr:hypothetical protein [Candidatus Kaiserbacteria bacterium]
MEDQEIVRRMEAMEKKLDEVYASSEKTRKLLFWITAAAVAAFVLPLIGLLFAVPSFLSVYSDISSISM